MLTMLSDTVQSGVEERLNFRSVFFLEHYFTFDCLRAGYGWVGGAETGRLVLSENKVGKQ